MAFLRSLGRWCVVVVARRGAVRSAAAAQESPAGGGAGGSTGWAWRSRASYRRSDDNRFKTSFTIRQHPRLRGDGRPRLALRSSRTSPCSRDAAWGDLFTLHGKVDLIDLYDRNPTSTGQKVDVDEAWVRFGREPEPATLAPGSGSTQARQDRQVRAAERPPPPELRPGLDRLQPLRGDRRRAGGPPRPAFLRQGRGARPATRSSCATRTPWPATTARRALPHADPDPELNSGIDILYNAQFANFNVDGKLETGGGSAGAWPTRRGATASTCSPGVTSASWPTGCAIHGTFYGGDLDILNGPERPA